MTAPLPLNSADPLTPSLSRSFSSRAMVSRPTLASAPTSSSLPTPLDLQPHSHRALSVRGPQSLSSRSHAPTNNGRRHHRSHRGVSAQLPQNEFPIFSHTGDVEIVISVPARNGQEKQERRYLLHRLILAQCSGFFEAGMSEEWERSGELGQGRDESDEKGLARIGEGSDEGSGSVIGGGSKGGSFDLGTGGSLDMGRSGPMVGRKRWRYELDWENKEDDEEPMLIQKTPSMSLFSGTSTADLLHTYPPIQTHRPNHSQNLSTSFFRSVANLALPSHHANQTSIHLPTSSTTTYTPSYGSNPTTSPPEYMDATIQTYNNLFLLFYNHAPLISSTHLPTAYIECKSLLTLADMYDSLLVIGPKVEHALLRFSSRLFKQIAKYPPSYLKLGYLARSRVIFSEALIHVVGQWPHAKPHLMQTGGTFLPDSVLDLIEDKVDELEDAKAKIEAKLFRLILTTSRGERVTPHNAYVDWLALSLFRSWLAENTTPQPAPILKNMTPSPNPNPNAATTQSALTTPTSTAKTLNTGKLYRQLGSTNKEAYLPHDELKRFLKTSAPNDYSRDRLHRLERKMDEIKNLARDVVKPLMRNFLELDLAAFGGPAGAGGGGGGSLGYLTCTRVEDEDLPWD